MFSRSCRESARWLGALTLAGSLLTAGSAVQAQMVPAPPPLHVEGEQAAALPDEVKNAGITEKLQQQVPLDLTFTNEAGEPVELSTYFTPGKPVLLNLGYYECPMLCGLVWQGMVKSLKQLSWTPGNEFTVVTVSFAPKETAELAAKKKATMIDDLGRPEAAAGWHFLTGSEENVRALADAVGFGYQWVEAKQQYAHTAAMILLTPEGKVSRYLYGIEFPAKTLRLSLVEASEGKAGSTADQILLYCFNYDPTAGQYTVQVMNLMRLAGVTTLVVLFIAITVMAIKGRTRRSADGASAT